MRHAYFRPLLLVGLLWGGVFTGFAWRVNNPPVHWQAVHAAAAAAEQPPPVRSTALAAAAPREAAPHRLAVFVEAAVLHVVQQPAPPAPAIRLPMLPAPPQPTPVPSPVTKLGAAQWYIIDADAAVTVITSPPGLVGVGSETGPIKMRGYFVDGKPGVVETRTYAGKNVYCLDAMGTGKVELIIIPSWAKGEKDIIRTWLDVSTGPPVPPDPPPGPVEPTDPLWPALKAAFVTDLMDKASAAKLASIYRGADAQLGTSKTQGELTTSLHNAAEGFISGKLPKVRRVLADELNIRVPATTNGAMTDALRTKYREQFTRFAALLEVLK
jgi:hypothetical protein